MGYKAIVTKEASMGDFAATFNGAASISTSVFAITSWFAISFRENGLYVEKFKRFMNAKEKIINGTDATVYKKPVTIKFENVSFKYPGTEKYVLKNINLEISPYKKIALVGYNGAGKTTLTNLLLRLYDVTEGRITIDGKDIREWDIASYHRNFAAVFQDFSIFAKEFLIRAKIYTCHYIRTEFTSLSKKTADLFPTVEYRNFPKNIIDPVSFFEFLPVPVIF